MKKMSLLVSIILVLFLLSARVQADTMVIDDDAGGLLTDINAIYWESSDVNTLNNGQLKNSNPETEEAWLEALLGKVYNNPDVTFIQKIAAGSGGLGSDVKTLDHYDPGFGWEYAVVKYGNYWVAYADTGSGDSLETGDNKLTISGELSKGISHVTFFDPPTQQVPEPTTLLLLGLGWIGLVGFNRKSQK